MNNKAIVVEIDPEGGGIRAISGLPEGFQLLAVYPGNDPPFHQIDYGNDFDPPPPPAAALQLLAA